jgi:actin-related protein
VIDIGNRMQIIPINDGVIEKHATTQLKKGVTNTTKYMSDLLQDKGMRYSLLFYRDINKVIIFTSLFNRDIDKGII